MSTKTPETPLQLIAAMLDALDGLGNSGMARIDARAWHRHFKRRAKKVGWAPAPTKKGRR